RRHAAAARRRGHDQPARARRRRAHRRRPGRRGADRHRGQGAGARRGRHRGHQRRRPGDRHRHRRLLRRRAAGRERGLRGAGHARRRRHRPRRVRGRARGRRGRARSGDAGRTTVIVIVGIGADGWPGLGEAAQDALRAAPAVIGSERQLALLPADVPGERRPWPSPIDPLVDALAAGRHDGAAVLASGDPMLHGIGSSLARRGVELAVHPHASAFAYACARLGWPEAEVDLVTIVGRSPDTLARVLQPRRRVVVFGNAASAAAVLVDRGYGPSRFVVLEQLGGPNERLTEGTADSLGDRAVDPLHAVAIECVAAEGTPLLPRIPGLPDEAYDTDGALTKRSVRAATLAALAPLPRALLWDVGAGSGSIGIEWLR